VSAFIADEATVFVCPQQFEIIARGAVRAPQYQDGIGQGESPPFLPLINRVYNAQCNEALFHLRNKLLSVVRAMVRAV